MSHVAIIPARGGSKRIPRKNVRLFHGKPMIVWSIEAAKQSHCFDRIVVSTDDEEIAGIALQAGAEVPFLRPSHLADDHSGTVPVVAHAMAELGNLPTDALICCIYATAPFILPEDLRQGCALMLERQADYAFPVTTFPFPIQRALRLDPQSGASMFWPEHAGTRSQDLPTAWHDAGQFYWGTQQAWTSGIHPFQANAVAVPIPRHRVQDIDVPEDWKRAEVLHRVLADMDTVGVPD
ncbi:pseudaminic acid cytidylyltransferase [Burkholderiaceae bacterium DAT-1]|nr:pseudaminic acid cytidylyltransferase [Burkholderiaceae bacterium DAT-1]